MNATEAQELQKTVQQGVPSLLPQKQVVDVEQYVESDRKESITLKKCLTDQKLQELTKKLSATEKKLQVTLATQQSIINKCRNEGRVLQRKQLESHSKLTAIKVHLACRITASEQMIQTQEATLNKHQERLEKVTRTGTLPFEFTMTDFEKHKESSDKWFSPPFYTHTQGYKMCIAVYANGFAWTSKRNTHLSACLFNARRL